MKRVATLFLGLLLLAATQARAEVCVVLVEGEFSELQLNYDEQRGVVWAKTTDLPESWCLNLQGDTVNDDYPTYAITWYPDESLDPTKLTVLETEPPLRVTPVVVWPRYEGGDWELMYSFWDIDNSQWHTTGYVERYDNTDDDTDPSADAQDKDVVLLWTRNGVRVDTMRSVGNLVNLGDQWDVRWTDAEVVVPQLRSATGPGRRSVRSGGPGPAAGLSRGPSASRGRVLQSGPRF